MSYWSAFIDGESRSVWMRRLSALFSISFREGWSYLFMTLNVMWHSELCEDTLWKRVFFVWIFCSTFCTCCKLGLYLVEWMLMAVFCCSPDHSQPYQFDPMVWAKSPMVETWERMQKAAMWPAWCWLMYLLHQGQEKQHDPVWSTAAPCRDLFSLLSGGRGRS